MSSAPSGLDVKEYGYCLLRYAIADGVEHTIRAFNKWNVTRIQFFCPDPLPAGGCYIITGAGVGGASGTGQVFLEAGGCVTLEPNGAFRGDLIVFGEDALLIVEAWFQATPDGTTPDVEITP